MVGWVYVGDQDRRGYVYVCVKVFGREVDQDEGDRPRDEILPSLGHCYS